MSIVWKVPFDLYRMGMGEGKLDTTPGKVLSSLPAIPVVPQPRSSVLIVLS